MRHTAVKPSVLTIGLALLIALAGTALVTAYAEEPLLFVDRATGVETDDEVSSIHDDLTYALALAAGFSEADADELRIWNQLVDSEALGVGDAVSYTNCGGAFPLPPDPAVVCPTGTVTSTVAWPLWGQMHDPATCMTSRFGPYSPFFHFPHVDGDDLAALHDWAWGITDTLVGYEVYAWGGATVLRATCTLTRPAVVSTTLPAGSLAAFATYLHSLGDAYSHRECLAALAALTPPAPWGTHTNPLFNDIPPCNYVPSNPSTFDAHGREFGGLFITETARTVEGIVAIYGELAARSLAMEGVASPLGLDTALFRMDGTPTLREAIEHFVTAWSYDSPLEQGVPAANRRAYAADLADAVLQQRLFRYRVLLPLVLRQAQTAAGGGR